MTQIHSGGEMDRRAFLKGMAGLGGALLTAGWARAATHAAADHRIGVQLYTVRDQMQADFEGTIEKVAQIGYKEVEFAGYYERTPEQVRQLLDRLGLSAPSAHVGLEPLRTALDAQLQSAATIGHRYVTVPAIPGAFGGQIAPEEWHRLAEEFNRLGTACQEHGLRFAYHNHAFEFVPAGEGKTGFDVLLSETDPALVSFELDLMWTVVAGRDPVALFEQYPGRFVMWHVKDLREIETARAAAGQGREGFRALMERIAAVGTGEIDFARIFARAEQSGLEHFFVENDAPKDSLADVRTSYEHLSELLAQR